MLLLQLLSQKKRGEILYNHSGMEGWIFKMEGLKEITMQLGE